MSLMTTGKTSRFLSVTEKLYKCICFISKQDVSLGEIARLLEEDKNINRDRGE